MVTSRIRLTIRYLFRAYRSLVTQSLFLATKVVYLLPRGAFVRSDLTTLLQNRKSKIETDLGSLLLINNSWVTDLRMKNFSTAEPETLQWIRSFEADEVFWDVGANVGMYSLYAALGRHKVVALEPSPWNLEALTKNILQNNFGQLITVVPLAVSNQVTQTNFYVSNKYQTSGGAHHSIGNPIDQFGAQVLDRDALQVVTISIDSLITIFKLPKPNHLKVDIDGLEFEVLQGASETLSSVRSLLVECFPNHPERENLFVFLEQKGFCLESYSSSTSNSIWRNEKWLPQ